MVRHIDCSATCRCNLFTFADSPVEETDASHQIAGKKRPLSAVLDLDSQHESGKDAATLFKPPRRRDQKPTVRVEKTPSLTTPLETPLPSPRVKELTTRNSVSASASVLSTGSVRGHQDAASGKRSKNAIPSSQSPSPLKSPAADVVRKQLAAILETEGDDQANDSLSPEGQLPPVRNRADPAAPNLHGPNSNPGLIRKKSRPKSVPRHKVRQRASLSSYRRRRFADSLSCP